MSSNMILNRFIKSSNDLITSKEQTRAGFISFALEKNRKSSPYIEQAKILKLEAQKARSPTDLLMINSIQSCLLTAAGLSDKSLKYFNDNDKKEAIDKLIEEFLFPAGEYFVDELVYRYLLIKGDSLGGSMRNTIGSFAEQKLKRTLIACLEVQGIKYKYSFDKKSAWIDVDIDKSEIDEIEKRATALYWEIDNNKYILTFNLKVPIVNKNVDILLFNADYTEFKQGRIVNEIDKYCMLGELKGGIDPAGADEHWKTANSALDRIRAAFTKNRHNIYTSFLGAAIEKSMADEIFAQLQDGRLSNAANFSNEQQLQEYCLWLVDINRS